MLLLYRDFTVNVLFYPPTCPTIGSQQISHDGVKRPPASMQWLNCWNHAAQEFEGHCMWSAVLTSDLSTVVAAVSLLGNTTEKVRAVNQVRDPARKRCVLLSTCPPELLSCFFSPRFSFSNERRSRYTSAHSLCPPHALFTASLEVGLIVMGAASWIIKHIFSTIGCDLAKWMWMRAFPSYLYYLTRNGWRMDGRDRGARAAASSHIHSHHSQSVSVSLLLHNFFYLVFPSLLHSRCLPFSITSYSFLHLPSLYLCLSLPEDFYLISLLTEM